MTRRVVDPARLGFVDVVTSSHGHTDHLDPVTLRPLRPRALVCPAGLRDLALERAGVVPQVVDVDETVAVGGFRFTAVRADHDVPGGAVGFVVECGRGRSTTPATRLRTQVSASGCARLLRLRHPADQRSARKHGRR